MTGAALEVWKASRTEHQRTRKGPAVEGFPSRDGQADVTLGEHPGAACGDTPHRRQDDAAGVLAKVLLALRNHSSSAITPMMICGRYDAMRQTTSAACATEPDTPML